MSEAEQNFIDQYTRSLTVGWAKFQVATGDNLPLPGSTDALSIELQSPYLDHAISRGWISKKSPPKLLATGFTTAAGFLKR